MGSEFVGRARRTSLVSTFGVGSLYPAESDSVMICGLDEWPKYGQVLHEPRLEASLGVEEFRLPTSGRRKGDVPVVRFPTWAFCPKCRRLDVVWKLTKKGSRVCVRCHEGTISPSRFVACCTNGHIEDFPYRAWVHGKHVDADDHDLWLQTRGESSALADLRVECKCGKSRSLDGAFGVHALREVKKCGGKRPWLPSAAKSEAPCDQPLRTLQRGSSNVWFASTRSAISIPSVRQRAVKFVRPLMKAIGPTKDPTDFAAGLTPPKGLTVSQLAAAITELRTPVASRPRPTDGELRAEEYDALVAGLDENENGSKQFLCSDVDMTHSDVPRVITQVCRVSRLREVRALAGFSRVVPGAGPDETAGTALAPLSAAPVSWLPGMEVLGEGIFFRLDEERLSTWASGDFATGRVRALHASQADLDQTSLAARVEVTARSLALHSLAHAVLDECSLTCGYPTASLRERVYDADGQAGILIYTATADSAGSLGGLAALSDRHRFAGMLRSAIDRAQWCTSDPVCIESGPSGVNGMNLCACHACLLLPETSCERMNLMLDRACLVGSPAGSGDGLFS